MPIEKVKPLKIEPLEGDQFPTEADASEDYLSAKGVAFEGLDTFLAEKVGGILGHKIPDGSWKYVYYTTGPNNGSLEYAEFFEGATQTTGFRRMRIDPAYTSNNLTSEVIRIYDPADGTTVLRTITYTYTYTGSDVTSAVEVTT